MKRQTGGLPLPARRKPLSAMYRAPIRPPSAKPRKIERHPHPGLAPFAAPEIKREKQKQEEPVAGIDTPIIQGAAVDIGRHTTARRREHRQHQDPRPAPAGGIRAPVPIRQPTPEARQGATRRSCPGPCLSRIDLEESPVGPHRHEEAEKPKAVPSRLAEREARRSGPGRRSPHDRDCRRYQAERR